MPARRASAPTATRSPMRPTDNSHGRRPLTRPPPPQRSKRSTTMTRLAKILIAGTAALILPVTQACADGSNSAGLVFQLPVAETGAPIQPLGIASDIGSHIAGGAP